MSADLQRMTSREFSHGLAKAKDAAIRDGAVVITDHGRPSFVLLSAREYERLTRNRPPTHLLFASQEDTEVELPTVRLTLTRDDSLLG